MSYPAQLTMIALVYSATLACSSHPKRAPQLTVLGVNAGALTSYCLSPNAEEQAVWVKGLAQAQRIPLKRGALRPARSVKRPLPQFHAPDELRPLDPSALSHTCSRWEPLPERGALSWSVGEEQLKVGRWGWASGLERRVVPRALSVMSLDPKRGVLFLAGLDGLWLWPLKSKGAPFGIPTPRGLKLPINGLTRDGGGLWVRGSDGQAVAVKLEMSAQRRPSLSVISGPLTLPNPPTELSVPLGGRLLSIRRGGVQLSWGEHRRLVAPTSDLALLDAEHVALATSEGVSVYQHSSSGQSDATLTLISELKLGAPVSALIAHQEVLYILSPALGLLWAEWRSSEGH